MKKVSISGVLVLILAAASFTLAQGTTFTGTAVIYGSGMSTRTVSTGFTLTVNSKTSPSDASRLLSALDNDGQSGLLKAMDGIELGRFSLTGKLGEPLTAVAVDQVEGGTRIRAVFKRWIGFGEIRGGYRSADYPFSYVEIVIDGSGKGDGTFFPAARIRMKQGKNGAADTVEIEDFGTFPGRLMGVRMRGARLS